ncbi:IS30 family transposase [Enterococcus thailandicus]|nr:IS30 family transposase [Enterococcus thailandicus]MDA3965080.1 IS30 family transposase [Enterococcus thailandicus]MDT2752685.1 IS30 family transposase [Enterococcus thailandicus]MDT2776115.1 IS30 family transposase [Enterococcus thailandicus]MDT2795313.1 IS30 family transposase [Enterococcus thailandicus]
MAMSHYNHLTILERENIFLFFNQGKSIRSIASLMKRSPSTISRELKRNTKNTTYSPVLAQTIYSYRKQNCGRKLLLSNNRVWTIVRRLFVEEQWSPEEISHRLKSERTGIAISYTTIYRGIYNGLFETEPLSHRNRGLVRSLRRRGKTRHAKHHVERRGKIEKKLSLFVKDTFIELFSSIHPSRVKSITPDRGKEFSKHSEITKALNGVPFYFPDPHAPWQRGTNENTNGLLREYLPKNKEMDSVTDETIDQYILKLNLRPRKCLHWKTPYEIFFGVTLHLI